VLWWYEPVVEEIEESLEFLTGDIRDGDCGIVCCPFLGFLLLLVDGLWEVKHILEKPSF
jgi:hypothetical protein